MKSLDPHCIPSASSPAAAVILAAGSATRMGGQPKCLLQMEGASLIERQIQALQAAGLGPIVVVLGHYAEAIQKSLRDLPVHIVYNPHPQQGQASSLRLGLGYAGLCDLASDAEQSFYVGLADQPLIGHTEIADLLWAHYSRPAGCEFTLPWVSDLPGNPVIFTSRVRHDLLQAQGEWGGRQWQKAHPNLVFAWRSNNPNYRIDLDTPEDVQAFTLRTGCALRWPTTARG